MSYSKQISDLRANNWRHLTNLQAQSTTLGKIESAQHTDQAKLWGLLGEKGTTAIKALHAQHMERRQAMAISDLLTHGMDSYLASDEAKLDSETLKRGEDFNSGINNNLINVGEGIPYHLKAKANKLGGAYEATMHRLHLAQVANRYPSEIRSQLLKREDELILPDGTKFKINEAETIEQKMAAHNYLRNEFFSKHGITAASYTKGFLSLSPEKGGSGFLASIRESETGKNGLFNKYQTEANIIASQRDQALMKTAFYTQPNATTFKAWIETMAMGVDADGDDINWTGAWEIARGELKSMAENNQIPYSQVQSIAKTEFKVNGVTQEAKYHWPDYFGDNGVLTRAYFKGKEKGSKDVTNASSILLSEDVDGIIERIKTGDISTQETFDLAHKALIDKFGVGEHLNAAYNKLNEYWNRNGGIDLNDPDDIKRMQEQIADIVKASKKNLVTDRIKLLPDIIQAQPAIQAIVQREAKYTTRDVDKTNIDLFPQMLNKDYKRQGLGDKVYYGSNVKAPEIVNELVAMYINYQEEGDSPFQAATKVKEHYEKESKDKNGRYYADGEEYPNFMPETFKSVDYLAVGNPLSNFTPAIQSKLTNAAAHFGGDKSKLFGAINNDTDKPLLSLGQENKILEEYGSWSDYIKQTGDIPVWARNLASYADMSVGEWLNLRSVVHGHGRLDDAIYTDLNGKNHSMLPSYLKKRVFGNITDGAVDVGAEMAQNSNGAPFFVYDTATGNTELSDALALINNLGFEDDGNLAPVNIAAENYWNNIPIAFGATLSDTFSEDFNEDGAFNFTEAIYENAESVIGNLINDETFGEKMYSLTGDINALPFLEGAKLDPLRDNRSAIINAYLSGKLNPRDVPQDVNVVDIPKPQTVEETPVEEAQTKEPLTIEQAQNIEIDPNHEVFNDLGQFTNTREQMANAIEQLLTGSINGNISDIPQSHLQWAIPFLDLYNINPNPKE